VIVKNFDDLVCTEFSFKSDLDAWVSPAITITRQVSPFYDGERFAVRCGGNVLRRGGGWEYETIPSERDNLFYNRCRFTTFEKAVNAARRERQKNKEAKDGPKPSS
jgi:hypothetical protein